MRKRTNLLLALAVIMVFILPIALAPAAAAQGPSNTTVQVVNKIYNLYATDGYWTMADGTQVYSYGFVGGERGKPFSYMKADGSQEVVDVPGGPPDATPGPIAPAEAQFAGNAQFPAPLIYCKVGDVVEIRLKNLGVNANPNAPNDPHSLHMHGLDVDAANDGVPETSVATVPANSEEPGSGNVVVYMFTAKDEGTAFYHCHQEADIHVTMGMYGALIVYDAKDAGSIKGPGYQGDLFGYRYDRDYVFLLSDTDVRQHLSEEYANLEDGTTVSVDTLNGPITTVLPYNPVDFKPQYWFINGLSFPNTVHAGLTPFNWDNWIKTHPGYDPLLAGSPTARSYTGATGERILVRMINMGFQAAPMHVHGFHPKVIGSDQRAWSWASNPVTGKGLEKNTTLIGSGEAYELLFDMSQQRVASTYPSGTFPGGTQSRYEEATGLPKSNTLTSFPAIPDPFVFEPYLPQTTYIGGPPVTGAFGGAVLNVPPTQIFPYHNHDDYKATNNGVYPGGMFTVIKMLP